MTMLKKPYSRSLYLLLVFMLAALALPLSANAQASSGYTHHEPVQPCNTVEWLRNRNNITVLSGGGLLKTSATNANSAGGLSCHQNLSKAGDTFTFQVTAVGGYIGLSYEPGYSQANTNANFAWFVNTLTTAQVWTGALGTTATGLNLVAGQRLRLRLDAALRVVFEYETTPGSGAFTTFFTTTTPTTGRLYPFAALSNNAARIQNAQICNY